VVIDYEYSYWHACIIAIFAAFASVKGRIQPGSSAFGRSLALGSRSVSKFILPVDSPEARRSETNGVKTIRILLVDDQRSVRRGLAMRLELEPDITVVGEAEDGVSALSAASVFRPDVLVMDYEMPAMNGIEATRKLREMGSHSRVVMLSIHDNPAVKRQATEAGIDAFVAKHQPSEALLAAIRKAAGLDEREGET
jgi:CheY-like chemotaxis protein